MPHAMVLMKDMQDKDWLHNLQAVGKIRASINVQHGIVDGIAMVRSDQPMQYAMSGPICQPGSICDPYWVANFLLSKISLCPPLEYNAFVLLQVDSGARRGWQDAVRVAAEGKGAAKSYVAAAHLFGKGHHNAVVEVLSDDHETFLRLLLETTDVSGVRAAHVLHVAAGDTRGMGSEG